MLADGALEAVAMPRRDVHHVCQPDSRHRRHSHRGVGRLGAWRAGGRAYRLRLGLRVPPASGSDDSFKRPPRKSSVLCADGGGLAFRRRVAPHCASSPFLVPVQWVMGVWLVFAHDNRQNQSQRQHG
jgi:hypothetical protein